MRLRWVLLAAMAAMAMSLAPNFLLFHADDLGFGDLACYGHPVSRTPALDTLAAEGLRFTSFYSSSPVCTPSRAGLLTGRLMPRTGIYCADGAEACKSPEQTDPPCCNGVFLPGMTGGLPRSERTIAELLRRVGYSTSAIGKWHLDAGSGEHLPSQFGFNEYYGVPHGVGACPCAACFPPNRTCFTPVAGHAACEPTWAPCPVLRSSGGERERIVQQPADLLALGDQYLKAAESFVARSSNGDGSPWFLYYATHHVHSPQFGGATSVAPGAYGAERGEFGAALAELDRHMGRLLAAVDAAGAAERTFVLFLSDNGPSLRNGVHGGNAGLLKCGKGTTYEGGQRTPAIARWPGHITAGRTTHEVASALDVLPTLLDFAGVGKPDDITLDGYSMRDILLGPNPSPSSRDARVHTDWAERRAGRHIYYPQFVMRSRGAYAARAGAYKAHFATQGSMQCNATHDVDCGPTHTFTRHDPPLVFNLELDPAEQYPLDPSSMEYRNGLAAAHEVLRQHEANLEWYPKPLLNSSVVVARQPCAKPGCKPFPSCCATAQPNIYSSSSSSTSHNK